MSEQTSERSNRGKGGATIKGINQDTVFEFFIEEKILKILQGVYDIAINDPDPKNRLRASREILDRVLGKPPIRQEITTNEQEFRQIIVGNLKGDNS